MTAVGRASRASSAEIRGPAVRLLAAGASAGTAVGTWQAQVVGIFLGSRVVSTLLVLAAVHFADPSALGWQRTLLEALTTWDGGWYRSIAGSGYPAVLPMLHGHVQGNAWAFLPLYPLLVAGAGFGNPDLYPAAQVVVSTVCGAGAAIALAALVRPHVGRRASIVTAALFALGPAGYVLEIGYAESTGLLLLFLLLLAVDRRRYGAAALIAVPLAFTRPGMQAISLFVLLHLLGRFLQARRSGDALRRRAWAAVLGLAVWTLALGSAWPLIAGAVTGVPDAYLLTELSWRATSGLDPEHMTYFLPWVHGAIIWFGKVQGLVVLFNAVLIAVGVLFLPAVRRAGWTIRSWYGSFLLYLFAVFFPQSSIMRLCLPLAPIAAPLGRLRGWQVAALLASCVSVQALLVWNAFGSPMSYASVP